MKARHSRFFIPTILSASIIACSGGGGQLAGIGGSGYISTGTVTGFGSVLVNGHKFEIESTTVIEVEDNENATQAELSVGMVVQVFGSITGVNPTATRIHYSDDLEGPITFISENADATAKTFSVLGNNVVLHTADTIYNGGASYSTLADGDILEVSGFYDNANVLQASYVELKSPSSSVEIAGEISGLPGSTFIVNGVNIDPSSAILSNLPDALVNGLVVEVKGTYNSTTNTITANEIEGNDDVLIDDGSTVSIEGYISNYVDNANFKINNQLIDATTATLIPAAMVLEDGIKVDAEGVIDNGVLVATEVETRNGNDEVTAVVNGVDTVNNRITVSVVASQPSITIQLTPSTITEDDIDPVDQLNLSSIIINTDYVEVRGFKSGPGTITATRVKRIVGEKIKLQSVVEVGEPQIENVSVTLLGVSFPVDMATTEYFYEMPNGSEGMFTDHADFISATTPGQTLISIEDEDKIAPDGNPFGVADSVEIEIP